MIGYSFTFTCQIVMHTSFYNSSPFAVTTLNYSYSLEPCFKNLYGNKYSPFLTCKNFLSYEMPEGKGVIVINPPYGERLDSDEFNKFHEDILNKAKNSADKKAYLLMPTESPLQIKSFKKIPEKNGNINCDWILC